MKGTWTTDPPPKFGRPWVVGILALIALSLVMLSCPKATPRTSSGITVSTVTTIATVTPTSRG